MKTVFADTYYFLALINPSDQRHQQAKVFTASFMGPMVTTAWVVTELGPCPKIAQLSSRRWINCGLIRKC